MHHPQSYERQPGSMSYRSQQPFGPGMPISEMDQQLTLSEAMPRYPLSTESSSKRPQLLQQQYDCTISGAGHPLYSVVPTIHIPSSWPGQSTQYMYDSEPSQQGSPTRGHAHLPAQAARDHEREHQGQPWTPPPLPHFSLPVPSCDVSPPSNRPQLEGGRERERGREVNEERERDKETNEKGEELNENEDRRANGDGEVYGRGDREVTEGDFYDNREGRPRGEVNNNGREEGEGDDVWGYCMVLTYMVALQLVVEVLIAAVVIVLN
jgi:hypothetical protein